MKELLRDTAFGHLLRLITRQGVLPYEEDRDPSLWKRYVDKEKSGRMAHHGHPGEEEKQEENGETDNENDSSKRRTDANRQDEESPPRNSSETRVAAGEPQRNDASGVPVDPERGRDVTIVTWFSEDDPEVGCSYTSFASSC